MTAFTDHPTVQRMQALKRGPSETPTIGAEQLRELALACGAADAGIVSVDDPAVDVDREHIQRAFPKARILLSYACRMHREPVRSPTRSLANLEFHNTGDETNDVGREIVRRLDALGIAAVNAATAFPCPASDSTRPMKSPSPPPALSASAATEPAIVVGTCELLDRSSAVRIAVGKINGGWVRRLM